MQKLWHKVCLCTDTKLNLFELRTLQKEAIMSLNFVAGAHWKILHDDKKEMWKVSVLGNGSMNGILVSIIPII